MTLLLTIIAGIVTTIIWYKNEQSKLSLGTLSLMYWGASIMWFIDAIFEYAEMGAEYFNQPIADIFNDLLLGVCVVVLGLLIWLVVLLIKDPCNRIFKNRK
jgi:EamA domain-containing membrane protein RarD